MNITVAVSLNYEYEYIKPFLKSFCDEVDADLFLITDNMNLPILCSKIHLVDVNELKQKYKITNLTPYNLKPVLFYLFLKEKIKQGYKTALIVDVDVIFQNNPFAEYESLFSNEKLVLGEERHPYKGCETNSWWFAEGYPHAYAQVAEKKILNCGVTIGPIDKLIDYQQKVTKELSFLLTKQNFFAYDQVILNYLTYITKTLSFNLLPHGNDYIVHLSQEDEIQDLTKWIKDGIIYNYNTNKTYSIVHQYDKKKGIKEFVQNKYK